jgi:hypothetical protein
MQFVDIIDLLQAEAQFLCDLLNIPDFHISFFYDRFLSGGTVVIVSPAKPGSKCKGRIERKNFDLSTGRRSILAVREIRLVAAGRRPQAASFEPQAGLCQISSTLKNLLEACSLPLAAFLAAIFVACSLKRTIWISKTTFLRR